MKYGHLKQFVIKQIITKEIKSKEAELGGYFNDKSGNKHNDKCYQKFENNNIGHL